MENAFHAIIHTFGNKQAIYVLIVMKLIYITLKTSNVLVQNKRLMNPMENVYLAFFLTFGMKHLLNVFLVQELINIIKN